MSHADAALDPLVLLVELCNLLPPLQKVRVPLDLYDVTIPKPCILMLCCIQSLIHARATCQAYRTILGEAQPLCHLNARFFRECILLIRSVQDQLLNHSLPRQYEVRHKL